MLIIYLDSNLRMSDRIHCEFCDIDFHKYGLKQHERSKTHLRAIGELPKKPEKAPKKTVGRPKIYETEDQRRERNREYYKNKTYRCELCDIELKYNYRNTHRGTKQHIANEVKAALQAAGQGPSTDPPSCPPCAPALPSA